MVKMLIVDDQKDIRQLLRLATVGLVGEVHEAADGPQALVVWAQVQPDIILLDVMMPELSGYEVCQLVRANPALTGVYILMLTAKGQEADRLRGLEAGADYYLTKSSYQDESILGAVRELLGQPSVA